MFTALLFVIVIAVGLGLGILLTVMDYPDFDDPEW